MNIDIQTLERDEDWTGNLTRDEEPRARILVYRVFWIADTGYWRVEWWRGDLDILNLHGGGAF